MSSLYLQLCVLVLLAGGALCDQPACRDSDDGRGRYCSMPSPPQLVSLVDGRLLVGAVDYLFTFSLSLSYEDGVDLSPSQERSYECEVAQAHRPALCRNFISVVQEIPLESVSSINTSSSILVCGTNAFSPKCRVHMLSDLSQWTYMSDAEHQDSGFSPHSPANNIALLASDGRFFTATFFAFRQTQNTIGMAPAALEGDATFTIQTPSSDPLWLNQPTFVSAYEMGERIYFFAREPAYEIDRGESVEYARVVRVCKNDSGYLKFSGDAALTFHTFQKARLLCTHSGSVGLPYNYDLLQSTSLVPGMDGGDPVLYGAFSSASNGPEGSAICKFSFGQIANVFEELQYLVRDNQNPNKEWDRESGSRFVCPGQEGQQRSEQEARDLQLMFSSVMPLSPQPLYRMFGDNILHLVVDIANYQGHPMEVMVAGKKSGEVVQLVLHQGQLYETTLLTLDQPASSLQLTTTADNLRLITLTTSSSLQSLSLGNCSSYSSCSSCLLSQDPYCAWDNTTGCINKMVAMDTLGLTDALTTSESDIHIICGIPPTVQPTATSCTHPSCSSSSSSNSSTDTPPHTPSPPSVSNPGGVEKSGGDEEDSAWLIVVVAVGGLLVGVLVGIVVCYIFFNTILKWSKPQPTSEAGSEQVQNNLTATGNGQAPLKKTYVDQTRAISVESQDSDIFKPNSSVNVCTSESPHKHNNIPNMQNGDHGDSSHVYSSSPSAKWAGQRSQQRGRTESTRVLRASESSDHSIDLGPTSSV